MATVVNVNGLLGANGNNGLAPTAGKNGGNATANYNGVINADSINITATGGNGGVGGNNTGAGAGAKGGNGGSATVGVNGSIFKPLGASLDIIGTAIGGNGGLGGNGTPIGATGNGGDATITFNGNIINTSAALTGITLDAVALSGIGAKYGNANASVNGNVITYNNAAATSVSLLATALAGGPDSTLNNGNNVFGNKTASVNGNIINGNVNNLSIYSEALSSNATASINGNIFNAKPANTGLVSLNVVGQKTSINGNILNLGQQNLTLSLGELGTTYSTSVAGNIFTGTGNNTFSLFDSFTPGPALAPNTATIDLGAGTLVFDGQSNILKNFANVNLSPDITASITGSNGNNILNGGNGDDFLKGLGGMDTLNGNGGNDILWGGTGNDTIDGGMGTDVAYFAGRESEYVLSGTPLPGGPFNVTGGPDGDDTLTNVERIKFLAPSHVMDVDNNGASDLIFQNNVNGNLQFRLQSPASTVTVNANVNWRAVGTGQFDPDFDRTADVLLQNVNNGNLEVITDITGAPATTQFSIQPGSVDWKAISTGDFNGDAASDVLLQNQVTGAAEIMFLNVNSTDAIGTVASVAPVTTPGANWTAISSGDFNADGKSDILWQNSVTKDVEVYLMNGAGFTNTPAAQTATGLTAIGTGDFNNDGFSDVLFQNGGGQAVIWYMNGDSHTGSQTIAPPVAPGTWAVSGAGDVDGNGFSDIVWYDAAANNARASLMGGPATATSATVLNANFNMASPNTNFHLVASTGGG